MTTKGHAVPENHMTVLRAPPFLAGIFNAQLLLSIFIKALSVYNS